MLENAVIVKSNGVHSPVAPRKPIPMAGEGKLVMGETNGLECQIGAKLAASEAARRLRQDQRRKAIMEMDERLDRYTAVADWLMEKVIRPCMQQLAGCFAGVDRPEDQQSRHSSFCRFPHTARFPATAALEMGVTRDGDARTVIVQYDLQILPIFHPINAHAHLDMPLDEVDQQRVAHWVEKQILTFVDSYLQLETAEPHQA